MQKQNFRPLKYLCYILSGLVLLTLVACNHPDPGRLGDSPTLVFAPGKADQIIVQLFSSPGSIFPSVNGVPEWTLYGDGMLLFRAAADSTNSSRLLEAQLSGKAVNQILNVVVNQYHFFAGTQHFYGRTIPDEGMTLLSVTANNQHRVVALGNDPGSNADAQSSNLFAIAQFLRTYRLPKALVYNPPGVVLLAIPTQATTATAWPYNDISLAQVAAKECPLLMPSSACAVSTEQAKVFSIAGAHGKNLLQQADLETMSQNGMTFQVLVWPVLPDAMNPPPSVLVAHAGQLQEWPMSQIGD